MSLLFPKKILIMCATGAHNLGDELILKGEVDYLKKKYGDHIEITVCSYDPTSAIIHHDGVRFVSYFPNDIRRHPLRNIAYLLSNIALIAQSDILVIGGGGILFDNEPGVSFGSLFWQWKMRVMIARLFGREVIFWGISLEIEQREHQMQLSQLFAVGDHIFMRDDRSQRLMEALDIPSRRIHDIVFDYEPTMPQRSLIRERLVGISVRGGFLLESAPVIREIYTYLISTGYKPIFLVFSTDGAITHNDTSYIASLMGDMPYHITKSIKQTLDMFPFLYAVVGMRLHAGILACVHEIPYLPISYGPKTDELVKTLDIEYLAIPRGELTLPLWQARWETLVTHYELHQSHIRDRHITIRSELRDQLRRM